MLFIQSRKKTKEKPGLFEENVKAYLKIKRLCAVVRKKCPMKFLIVPFFVFDSSYST